MKVPAILSSAPRRSAPRPSWTSSSNRRRSCSSSTESRYSAEPRRSGPVRPAADAAGGPLAREAARGPFRAGVRGRPGHRSDLDDPRAPARRIAAAVSAPASPARPTLGLTRPFSADVCGPHSPLGLTQRQATRRRLHGASSGSTLRRAERERSAGASRAAPLRLAACPAHPRLDRTCTSSWRAPRRRGGHPARRRHRADRHRPRPRRGRDRRRGQDPPRPPRPGRRRAPPRAGQVRGRRGRPHVERPGPRLRLGTRARRRSSRQAARRGGGDRPLAADARTVRHAAYRPLGPRRANRRRWRHPGHLGATASTTVHFAQLTDAEVDAYVATGEPLGWPAPSPSTGSAGRSSRGSMATITTSSASHFPPAGAARRGRRGLVRHRRTTDPLVAVRHALPTRCLVHDDPTHGADDRQYQGDREREWAGPATPPGAPRAEDLGGAQHDRAEVRGERPEHQDLPEHGRTTLRIARGRP